MSLEAIKTGGQLERISAAMRSKYWCWTFTSLSEMPASILDVLLSGLPHIDPQSWDERFDWGGVYVNGLVKLADEKLPFPCKVEYYEPKFEIAKAAEIFPRWREEWIIYSDDDLAVVFKPAKLSSMPAKEQRHYSLKADLEAHFGLTVHMPSRLDTSVSGLLAVSLSPKMHAPLQQLYENRNVHKEYTLQVSKMPEWKSKLVQNFLTRDPAHAVLRAVSETEGQPAETLFEVRENKLLNAFPKTGRTHQIRVHAAHLGYPIVGDNFYNGEEAESLHLCSTRLKFAHPLTGKVLDLQIPRELTPGWIISSR